MCDWFRALRGNVSSYAATNALSARSLNHVNTPLGKTEKPGFSRAFRRSSGNSLLRSFVHCVAKRVLRPADCTFHLARKLGDCSFGLHLLVADGLANDFLDRTLG